MALGVLVQGRKHDRQYGLDIITDEVAEVFIIPEIQCSFGNLEMRASHRFGQLVEERLLYFGKFLGVHDFENVLNFIQEHDLFCAVGLGPVSE